ncbi:hypothetical protein ACFFX1_12740 [Dactylosporangium sucinum]|uniref:Uncharacterized protein n=1 Tax=Dactylosporangium sucinum TaxID=1424081 RepID=A0A917WYC1_9ACTN|nr:hypothetical protein [Dactylosporangium sucinum]GGM41464.1 hypothetical protein GCM10007977_048580 [Dactylosporangium sucinum]
MTTPTTLNASVARVVRRHRPLMALSAAMAALAVACAAGLLLDDRTVVGAPVWLKPFKFSLSLMVYSGTLAWMITLIDRGRRLAHRAGTLVAVSAAGEMLLIVGQAARGRPSHFNTTTPLDDAILQAMGGTITLLWAGTLVLGVLLFRAAIADRANRWAVRLGVVLSLVGMSLGGLMVLPNAEQRRALEAGVDTVVGAHSVGVADGGPGMPLTGWSTTGGDLRIPHFVGLHALQVLPLLALLLAVLAHRYPRLTERRRTGLVLLGAALFTGLLALVTWQALRGEPLVHPGAATLAAAGLLAAAGVAGTAAALR